MITAVCPRCASAVALYDGRPQITEAGSVVLWHLACYDARTMPVVEAAPAPAPVEGSDRVGLPARGGRWRIACAAVAALALIGVMQWISTGTPQQQAVASVPLGAE